MAVTVSPVGVVEGDQPSKSETLVRPVLTVEESRAQLAALPKNLVANGSVGAWQEAVIGAEIGGQRLVEINAQVGDRVKKGQVLAVFDREKVDADVAQSRAVLNEAEANLAEARANAERVRQVLDSGALSAQQVSQYLTGEKTAEARMRLTRAQLDQQLLRLRHIRVVASDDGVISSRSATLGAVVAEGHELFRLIRQNRLEWRAEVTALELSKLKPGLLVMMEAPGGTPLTGKVRIVAPTLDNQSRNALVYVDVPGAAEAGLRPGMFVRGRFLLGEQRALVVPQTALVMREGFSYVFRLNEPKGGQARVSLVKVQTGETYGERVEILSGLEAGDRLVRSGGAFLTDGDSVRVVGP